MGKLIENLIANMSGGQLIFLLVLALIFSVAIYSLLSMTKWGKPWGLVANYLSYFLSLAAGFIFFLLGGLLIKQVTLSLPGAILLMIPPAVAGIVAYWLERKWKKPS